MSQLSFEDLVNGTVPDASDFNSRFNALKNRINNGMESDNIADNSITTAKINNSAVTLGKLDSGFVDDATAVTAVSTDYALIADASDSGNIKKALLSDIFFPTASNALAGSVVQVKYAENTTYSLITANIAYDAGYPEVTEGAQVLSRTITPTNASNKLLVEVLLQVGTAETQNVTAAVFKDGVTNAIAAGYEYIAVNASGALKVRKYIDAGSTSEQTFTVRMGGPSNNTEINGAFGALKHGGALISSITITEIKV